MLIMVTVIVVEPNNHNRNFMMIQQRKGEEGVKTSLCWSTVPAGNYESSDFDDNRSLPDRMRSGPFSYLSVGVRKYEKYSTTDA
jgi:hypothetical protein